MELTQHKTNVANEALTITVLDPKGQGNAHHLYRITGFSTSTNPTEKRKFRPEKNVVLMFQSGQIDSVGVNGVTHEALLAILIHRLQCFQTGPYANKFNGAALEHLEAALAQLQARTLERQARGVEGTHGL